MKKALITGITGQDGSYLAEFLLAKDYEVHGVIRRSSTFNTLRIQHLFEDPHTPNAKLHLSYADLTDEGAIFRLIDQVQPDEIYNLAAQSHVRVSFDSPGWTADVTARGALNILDTIRYFGRPVRYYQASSSEMFGGLGDVPQKETTPFHPRSPYAISKLFAHWMTVNYREAYDIFACSGILFNHESPRRGETFVTRKITRAVAHIKHGIEDTIYLGNLDAKRDWGFAGDYVEAMWLMLQQDRPDDYVIATGETHTVRDFLELAFGYAGLDWKKHVKIDSRYFRPTEVDVLCGDASKARTHLGWRPRIGFSELVRMMVDADMKAANPHASVASR